MPRLVDMSSVASSAPYVPWKCFLAGSGLEPVHAGIGRNRVRDRGCEGRGADSSDGDQHDDDLADHGDFFRGLVV